MTPWPSQIPLAVRAWLPLGLAAFVPLALLAATMWLSRRRERAIATVLALRAVLMLGFGFALLVTVASVSVVSTGLRELHQRHEAEVRAVAQDLGRVSPTRLAVEGQLKLTLFRAKDASVAFAAVGGDGCPAKCLVSADNAFADAALRQRLSRAWPKRIGRQYALSIGGKPYLLIPEPVIDSAGTERMLVAGIDAEYLAEQATRTAWVLLLISYALLALVGWTSWKQIDTTLGARIQSITAQIKKGSADEPIETLKVDGVELRELANTVSSYIKTTLEEQKSSDERHRRLVELAPDGVVMCSKSSIKFVNSAALALTGARSRYDMIGVPIEQFLEFEKTATVQLKSAPKPARWKRIDGTIVHVEVAEITEAGEGTAQYLVRDVTDARNREAILAHRAEHDTLTGLANRARFEARLHEVLTPGSENARLGPSRQVAVLFIDLDGFKPVNDTYGHAAGDAVLVAVADRLRDSTRNSDLIARLGGDEFAVLLEVRDHGEVTAVADRILASLESPIDFDGQQMHVGASIGIADTHVGAPGEASLSAAELLRAADAAMYTAKQSGGNRAAA